MVGCQGAHAAGSSGDATPPRYLRSDQSLSGEPVRRVDALVVCQDSAYLNLLGILLGCDLTVQPWLYTVSQGKKKKNKNNKKKWKEETQQALVGRRLVWSDAGQSVSLVSNFCQYGPVHICPTTMHPALHLGQMLR